MVRAFATDSTITSGLAKIKLLVEVPVPVDVPVGPCDVPGGPPEGGATDSESAPGADHRSGAFPWCHASAPPVNSERAARTGAGVDGCPRESAPQAASGGNRQAA